MFGNGSDGALNVASGTTNLLLDTKYQYTTVNVASGATLSTSSTTGSVLYILATTSIVINGTIDLRNKVTRGQNSWSVVIDGTAYSSPSARNGGNGADNSLSSLGGVQSNGFGGGGAGGAIPATIPNKGGNGGNGSITPGVGGASRSTSGPGLDGGGSSGGGGALGILVGSASSGAGGSAYGNNGTNGGGDGDGQTSGGGGGAGGQAGHPGVHVVLKSPSITVNGTIYTTGGNGGNGGNGGTAPAFGNYGSGGGGGGAGNGGNITSFATTYSLTGTTDTSGGFNGNGGTGYLTGGFGGAGISGDVTYIPIVPPADYTGPFLRRWDGTSWQYSKTNARTTSFVESKVKVL